MFGCQVFTPGSLTVEICLPNSHLISYIGALDNSYSYSSYYFILHKYISLYCTIVFDPAEIYTDLIG